MTALCVSGVVGPGVSGAEGGGLCHGNPFQRRGCPRGSEAERPGGVPGGAGEAEGKGGSDCHAFRLFIHVMAETPFDFEVLLFYLGVQNPCTIDLEYLF